QDKTLSPIHFFRGFKKLGEDQGISTGLEELAAECAAAQVVDFLHALENGVALGTESLDRNRHGILYPMQYNCATKNMRACRRACLRSLFCHAPLPELAGRRLQ
ncbi:MAG: hypothetical protein O2960_09065, partial [Verrucomicrobia bacterium]|nr:hypothetical protein [Verrucomicrobiota bacterium]